MVGVGWWVFELVVVGVTYTKLFEGGPQKGFLQTPEGENQNTNWHRLAMRTELHKCMC